MMKNILIIIENIGSSGGTERIASLLSSELSKKGHVVTLLTKVNNTPYYDLSSKVNLVSLKKNNLLNFTYFFLENDFDIIIPISMGRLGFLSSIINKLTFSKSMLYISEHGSFDSGSFFVKKLKLFGYMLADKIILLTEKDKKTISNLTKTKVVVIKNPSVYKSITKDYISSKKKVVLAVGRFTYEKNFQELIHIWHSLSKEKRSGWILKIVGAGKDKKELEDLICSYELNDSIKILPPQKNIDDFYKESSILTMTSRHEGLPLVLIEAKSFALVSISYDCQTGPSEIIIDNNDGFVVRDFKRCEYIKKLELLMVDDSRRSLMQKNALINSSSFSIQSIIERWESIL